jgi:3-hydroxyisobutyrate dehydrogenase-like beta-hydroxyacid dehydrogenase
MATVGIVGLGLLGGAVASRLRAAGHAVVGHDVAPARVAALEAMGGKAADSPAAVARAADSVCTVLPSLAVVEDVILGAAGLVTALRPEQPVIQMSTISPALTERLAAALGAQGLAFLDCPISGTSGMVERGDGIIFVGGERALYERWRPVLESVLPRSVFIGRAGLAMVLKLIANLLVALHSAAAAEALNMAARAGLDLPLALEVLRSSAAGSRMLDVRGPMMVRDEFPAQMKLDLFMKDLHLIQDAAGALGAGVPLTDVAERLYADAMARGNHGEDLSVVIRSLADLRSPAPAQTR